LTGTTGIRHLQTVKEFHRRNWFCHNGTQHDMWWVITAHNMTCGGL